MGILKRVRGTPIPTASYLAGMIGSAVLNAVVQVALVVAIGNLVYGLDWPRDIPLLAAFTALGVLCFGALGIAFAHAIPNVDSAPAYENAVFLPLIFISGVFYSAESLPAALEAIAQTLPLTHLIDGLSAAIVGGAVDTALAAAVVGGWAWSAWRSRCASFAGPDAIGRGSARRRPATAAARGRGGATSARGRATRGSGQRGVTRSARNDRERRGGPPRAPRRSRGSPAARAAAAS